MDTIILFFSSSLLIQWESLIHSFNVEPDQLFWDKFSLVIIFVSAGFDLLMYLGVEKFASVFMKDTGL